MAVRLGESLVQRRRFDPEDIVRRYVDWWREGAFDTGPTTAAVLPLVAEGVPVDEAVKHVHRRRQGRTAGCNPAHRVAPLGLFAPLGFYDLRAAAAAEASLTHRHPLAGDVAVATAVLIRALYYGSRWNDALTVASEGRLPDTVEALEGRRALSKGGFAPDVLAAAVHFVESRGIEQTAPYQTALEQAVEAAVEFAGPDNYAPVLTGVLSGVQQGLPPMYLEFSYAPGELGRLGRVADGLHELWNSSEEWNTSDLRRERLPEAADPARATLAAVGAQLSRAAPPDGSGIVWITGDDSTTPAGSRIYRGTDELLVEEIDPAASSTALRVRNRIAEPVVLLAGTPLAGCTRTRTIETPLVFAAHQHVEIPPTLVVAAQPRPHDAGLLPSPPADACGVLLLEQGQPLRLDVFDRPATLRAAWPALAPRLLHARVERPPYDEPPPLATLMTWLHGANMTFHGVGPGVGTYLAIRMRPYHGSALLHAGRTVQLALSVGREASLWRRSD